MLSIAPENSLGLVALICAISLIGLNLERTKLGSIFSSPGLVIIIAMAASNMGLMPKQAPIFDVIWTYCIPLGVALFLFRANLFSIFTQGGRVLLAFGVGVIGAAAGALIGVLALDLGPYASELAAVFLATYTGGSLNFAAVAQAIEFDDATVLTIAVTVDNVLGSAYLIIANLLGGWALLRSRYGWRMDSISQQGSAADHDTEQTMRLEDLLISLGLAAFVCAISVWAAGLIGLSQYSILVTTMLMTLIATLASRPLQHVRGESVLAMFFIYMFFAMIGAGVDLRAMTNAAPSIIYYVCIIIGIHVLVLFAAGSALRLNYAEMLVASLACISGPPTAAAIAILFGWRSLVLPGILTGILGYVLGTLLGVGVFHFLNDGSHSLRGVE